MLAQEATVTQERIERFRRLGGVELKRLEPEELDPLLAHIHVGTAHLKKAVFTFRCPLCSNTARNDSEMSPCCTGPSWTHDHEMTPMELIT